MKFSLALLHPKYWPTWLGLAVLRVLVLLPFRVQVLLGIALGTVVGWLPLPFKRTARCNIELCLPELDAAGRRRILAAHFRSVGIGVFETAMSWWASDARIRKFIRIEGQEHLQHALAQGKGVILLSAHFTTLEIGARSICTLLPTNIMYRPTSNLVLERFLARNRGQRAKRAIPRDDIRTLVSALKNNEPVWYAPDQSYRKKGAQMVPFFGIPAATNTATSRLARMTGCVVVPYFPERLPDASGYRMHLLPAMTPFPTNDPIADAMHFNGLIEAHVRKVPEQYLWIHRRFKGLTTDYPNYYKRGASAAR